MRISLIAAMAKNRVIGVDNALPWHLPDDFSFFKATTLNKPILMGRKTFESIGKPLPKRLNIVLSRQKDLSLGDGGVCVQSPSEAIEYCSEADELMVIGGAQVYAQWIDQADTVYLTEVDTQLQGDAYFPELDKLQWKEVSRESHLKDERHEYAFDIVVYQRQGD